MNVIVNEATIPALNILHISLYIFCLFVVNQSPTVDSFARDSEYVCACVFVLDACKQNFNTNRVKKNRKLH